MIAARNTALSLLSSDVKYFGYIDSGAIGDLVWLDEDADGGYDAGEPPPTWIPAGHEVVRRLADKMGARTYGSWFELADLPATAHASVELLKRSGVDLVGKHAVVVGRSNVIGKPVAQLLLRENATVTTCHSRRADLAGVVRRADIVVVAIGRAAFVTGDMLKPGAVVVDVGINVTDAGLIGDVDFDSAIDVASAITPVPGGVGRLASAAAAADVQRPRANIS